MTARSFFAVCDCGVKTRMQTFLDAIPMAKEKMIAA
jgi:hypothetical protein